MFRKALLSATALVAAGSMALATIQQETLSHVQEQQAAFAVTAKTTPQ